MMSLENTYEIVQDLEQRLVAVQSYPFRESLGLMLLSLALLVSTMISLALIFILSLLWLITWMWKKLIVLLRNIVRRASNVLFTLCPWAAAPKAITLPFKKLRNWQWRKDTDSHQDSTLAYSEMPGELKPEHRGVISEEQEAKIRRAGL
jgi:hypothetical protein